MTHSLEVAQIARSISKYLNLNDDLAETLSLAHDLGHTPFGHAGEEVLNDCMSNHGYSYNHLKLLHLHDQKGCGQDRVLNLMFQPNHH